jgi:hypothetical protein
VTGCDVCHPEQVAEAEREFDTPSSSDTEIGCASRRRPIEEIADASHPRKQRKLQPGSFVSHPGSAGCSTKEDEDLARLVAVPSSSPSAFAKTFRLPIRETDGRDSVSSDTSADSLEIRDGDDYSDSDASNTSGATSGNFIFIDTLYGQKGKPANDHVLSVPSHRDPSSRPKSLLRVHTLVWGDESMSTASEDEREEQAADNKRANNGTLDRWSTLRLLRTGWLEPAQTGPQECSLTNKVVRFAGDLGEDVASAGGPPVALTPPTSTPCIASCADEPEPVTPRSIVLQGGPSIVITPPSPTDCVPRRGDKFRTRWPDTTRLFVREEDRTLDMRSRMLHAVKERMAIVRRRRWRFLDALEAKMGPGSRLAAWRITMRETKAWNRWAETGLW